ncbi:hypothetical protein [Latilactobacillus sakei]|uniref:hypothetical protein n=1 Tax=Latilactobacillus sakei TaxID=1599 RepID=UPI002030BEC9|nr:hypothetical protein [Latilactobacillus sakei]MCM1636262.1 hypothetical protein [Latilactobacillus sakei]
MAEISIAQCRSTLLEKGYVISLGKLYKLIETEKIPTIKGRHPLSIENEVVNDVIQPILDSQLAAKLKRKEIREQYFINQEVGDNTRFSPSPYPNNMVVNSEYFVGPDEDERVLAFDRPNLLLSDIQRRMKPSALSYKSRRKRTEYLLDLSEYNDQDLRSLNWQAIFASTLDINKLHSYLVIWLPKHRKLEEFVLTTPSLIKTCKIIFRLTNDND